MTNHFATLHLPEHFALESDDLEQRYLAAIAACHPDNFPHQSQEQQQAHTMSEMVNQAYAVLANPTARAKHVFTLRFNESLDSYPAPQATLFAMMELQEDKARATTLEQQHALAVKVRKQHQQAQHELAHRFSQGNAKAIAEHIHLLAYLDAILTGTSENLLRD